MKTIIRLTAVIACIGMNRFGAEIIVRSESEGSAWITALLVLVAVTAILALGEKMSR